MMATSGFRDSHGPFPSGDALGTVPAHRQGQRNCRQAWLEMSVSCRFFGGPNRHDTTTCRQQCRQHQKSCRRHRTHVATRRPCRCCVVSDEYLTCLRRVGEKLLIVVLSTTIRKIHNRQHNHPHHGSERPPSPAGRILRLDPIQSKRKVDELLGEGVVEAIY
jgi:hypothetical protein